MLYEKSPNRWKLVAQRRFHWLLQLGAGVHAAHGLAHALPPSRESRARPADGRPQPLRGALPSGRDY